MGAKLTSLPGAITKSESSYSSEKIKIAVTGTNRNVKRIISIKNDRDYFDICFDIACGKRVTKHEFIVARAICRDIFNMDIKQFIIN